MASPPKEAPKRKAKDPTVGLKPELYVGRGQTFAKHVLLKQYLTELALKVLQAKNAPSEFLYVDAFSGPWQAQGKDFEDTSFSIALDLLTKIRSMLQLNGRSPRIRAVFIEQNSAAFDRLRAEIKRFPEIEAEPFNKQFEDVASIITASLNRESFLFAFLDPIGWKGMPLRRIAPLLRHRRSEVLVNVMTNGIVRHAENEAVQQSMDEFFGDRDWRAELSEVQARLGSRDDAIIELYLRRLKSVGGFNYVGSTRIRNPDKDRTYFHLAYGTRHPAGMEVFRRCEGNCVDVQEQVALDSFRAKQERVLGMSDLFKGQDDAGLDAFKRWRDAARKKARAEFDAWLASGGARRADHLRAELMQHPHVDVTLVNTWAKDAEKAGLMTRTSGTGTAVIWKPAAPAT